MSHTLDFENLRKQFISAWNTMPRPSVTMLYDNSVVSKTPPAKFIRFAVRPSGEEAKTLGDSRFRLETHGRIRLQIGVPNTSTDEGWRLADQASAIFRGWHSPDGLLRCFEADRSISSDSTHYLITVTIRYSGIHYT